MLAQKAASLIKEKDVIFIDAGTTTAFLIHELVNKNVTVVTNSIHHAAQLVEKQIPTVMVGGNVKTAKNWTNLLCQGSPTQTRYRYH
ncbi:transcriptional repressor of fructose operon [Streptococcus pneumoniae]|nr:transcriptional repressor of fructose operon [Streptococcus pneumoniae]